MRLSLRSVTLAAGLSLFFFNDTATTEIYTLSLHDALPISAARPSRSRSAGLSGPASCTHAAARPQGPSPSRRRSRRSEEHTSELQSHLNLVCRLLLEKKKNKYKRNSINMISVFTLVTCIDY